MKNNKVSKNIYQLPFIGNVDIKPAPFHFEQSWQRNAVDFSLNVGTPILAVEEGLVYKVIDSHKEGAFKKDFLNKCNLVIIKHLHGEHSCYAHLKKGIIVSEGQQIIKGQTIGYSGLSGYTNYPHLHYETLVNWITIPTRFQINEQVKILISPKK